MSAFLKFKGITHYPVMHREVSAMVAQYIEHYQGQKLRYQMLDCTFGGGNHSIKLLNEHKNLKILGTDLDFDVMEQCKLEYSDLISKKRLALFHSNYVNAPAININKAFGRKTVVKQKYDIALLDLGFSSYQLDDESRGFSYMDDEQMLDMRYDLTNEDGSNAHDIVNNSSELDLIQIFKKFGDERYSEQIAKAIIEERRGTIINTTGELKQLIRKAFQNKTDSKQAIKRVFQALRIATNYELLSLQKFLEQIDDIMDKDSLFMAITFHSIEEKMVAQQMQKWKKDGRGQHGTKKPMVPSEDELNENSRSKSAKLYAYLL